MFFLMKIYYLIFLVLVLVLALVLVPAPVPAPAPACLLFSLFHKKMSS